MTIGMATDFRFGVVCVMLCDLFENNSEKHWQRKSTHKPEVEWVLGIMHSSLQTTKKTNMFFLKAPKP